MSKLEAEVGLEELVRNSSMELVIIRAPAIYGQNAPGNFGLIEKTVRMGGAASFWKCKYQPASRNQKL